MPNCPCLHPHARMMCTVQSLSMAVDPHHQAVVPSQTQQQGQEQEDSQQLGALCAVPLHVLVRHVWPQLGPASRAALRATCRALRDATDSALPQTLRCSLHVEPPCPSTQLEQLGTSGRRLADASAGRSSGSRSTPHASDPPRPSPSTHEGDVGALCSLLARGTRAGATCALQLHLMAPQPRFGDTSNSNSSVAGAGPTDALPHLASALLQRLGAAAPDLRALRLSTPLLLTPRLISAATQPWRGLHSLQVLCGGVLAGCWQDPGWAAALTHLPPTLASLVIHTHDNSAVTLSLVAWGAKAARLCFMGGVPVPRGLRVLSLGKTMGLHSLPVPLLQEGRALVTAGCGGDTPVVAVVAGDDCGAGDSGGLVQDVRPTQPSEHQQQGQGLLTQQHSAPGTQQPAHERVQLRHGEQVLVPQGAEPQSHSHQPPPPLPTQQQQQQQPGTASIALDRLSLVPDTLILPVSMPAVVASPEVTQLTSLCLMGQPHTTLYAGLAALPHLTSLCLLPADAGALWLPSAPGQPALFDARPLVSAFSSLRSLSLPLHWLSRIHAALAGVGAHVDGSFGNLQRLGLCSAFGDGEVEVDDVAAVLPMISPMCHVLLPASGTLRGSGVRWWGGERPVTSLVNHPGGVTADLSLARFSSISDHTTQAGAAPGCSPTSPHTFGLAGTTNQASVCRTSVPARLASATGPTGEEAPSSLAGDDRAAAATATRSPPLPPAPAMHTTLCVSTRTLLAAAACGAPDGADALEVRAQVELLVSQLAPGLCVHEVQGEIDLGPVGRVGPQGQGQVLGQAGAAGGAAAQGMDSNAWLRSVLSHVRVLRLPRLTPGVLACAAQLAPHLCGVAAVEVECGGPATARPETAAALAEVLRGLGVGLRQPTAVEHQKDEGGQVVMQGAGGRAAGVQSRAASTAAAGPSAMAPGRMRVDDGAPAVGAAATAQLAQEATTSTTALASGRTGGRVDATEAGTSGGRGHTGRRPLRVWLGCDWLQAGEQQAGVKVLLGALRGMLADPDCVMLAHAP